jgi:hypothetical protein
MCQGISLVITRGRIEPYFISGNNAHHAIRETFGIRDDQDYPSLPVEFLPGPNLTDDPWTMRLDIKTDPPAWYTDQKHEYDQACAEIVHREVFEMKKSGRYEGSLDLSGCTGLTSLGSLKEVTGYLDLSGCTGLTSLGSLEKTGSLDLRGCTGLTSLGSLEKTGYLDLSGCTGLTSLGSLKEVTGYLNMSGCTGIKKVSKKICSNIIREV